MDISPFHSVPAKDRILESKLCFAVYDKYPVSPGHVLIVPFRAVKTWFEATPEEQAALFQLLEQVKVILVGKLGNTPSGWNIGVNVGADAGQTVDQLHVHLIPRYKGDVPDPTGGVRGVVPGKANYLSKRGNEKLLTGPPGLGDALRDILPFATRVDIVASFVRNSGLEYLRESFLEVFKRPTLIRILTGDYLGITQPYALHQLLLLQEMVAAGEEMRGTLEVRVIESKTLPAQVSFHPKSWIINTEDGGVAYVGSSNCSRMALQDGIEWNLRCDRNLDPMAWQEIEAAFAVWWDRGIPVTASWIAAYKTRAKPQTASPLEVVGLLAEEAALPEPRQWQLEALEELARVRGEGRRRALVTVAPGMGKTWLAVLDIYQIFKARGEIPRVLFIAHRIEILSQAAEALGVLAEICGCDPPGFYAGDQSDLKNQFVMASIRKLSSPSGIQALQHERIDYVVVDETHHAPACSYRRVLDMMFPEFMLGLTATPNRMDGLDVAGMYDRCVAMDAGIGRGIADGVLAPFRYHAVKDTINFEPIPWRGRRFDLERVAQAAQTQERMLELWRVWNEVEGLRSVVFCCNIAHASFVSNWLCKMGVQAKALHSKTKDGDRSRARAELQDGTLQALCTVDLFNEGVDLPEVDRVVFLRPTESPVIFLQQLGRGLRIADGKSHLNVIDFIGNHRSFLTRLTWLASIKGEGKVKLRKLLDEGFQAEDLPEGCSVEIELDARDLLRKFLPRGGNAVREGLQAFVDEKGFRPTASQLQEAGYSINSISQDHWFELLKDEELLLPKELPVVEAHGEWLRMLSRTPMNKSYKMILLSALLQHELFLSEGMPLDRLAAASAGILTRDPGLLVDLQGVKGCDDPRHPDSDWFLRYWKKNPVKFLCSGDAGKWFRVDGANFIVNLDVRSELRESFLGMTRELVDWRLLQYRQRVRRRSGDIECKIIRSGSKAIIKLDDSRRGELPDGLAEVALPDGSLWVFNFVKYFVNVARPAGAKKNQLHELLERWFGRTVGQPGTSYRLFFSEKDGWRCRPDEAMMVATGFASEQPEYPFELFNIEEPTRVQVFTLQAVAGGFSEGHEPESLGWAKLPDGIRRQSGQFIAQVIGMSMEPRIPDGSWCIFKKGVTGSRNGRIVVAVHHSIGDPEHGGAYTLKKYRSTKKQDADGSWEHESITLEPLNPAFAPIEIRPEDARDVRIIAEFISIL